MIGAYVYKRGVLSFSASLVTNNNQHGSYSYSCSSCRRPLFDHTKWNHHDDILLDLPRSSNLAEGWHHGFHTMMGCSNPTIWKFLDVLKKEQNLTDVKVAQHLSRQQPPKRAKKWTDYDDRLRRIVTDYDSYDLLDFLKAVGNAF